MSIEERCRALLHVRGLVRGCHRRKRRRHSCERYTRPSSREDMFDESQKGAAHLRVRVGEVWGLDRSTNSDTRNALGDAVQSLVCLDVALDGDHEAVVNLPKIDHVTVTPELLKPPCITPMPVMDTLEAMNHIKDLRRACRNGAKLNDFQIQAPHHRRALVILARRKNFSSSKNFFHDELIGSQKSQVVEALLCLGFGV